MLIQTLYQTIQKKAVYMLSSIYSDLKNDYIYRSYWGKSIESLQSILALMLQGLHPRDAGTNSVNKLWFLKLAQVQGLSKTYVFLWEQPLGATHSITFPSLDCR